MAFAIFIKLIHIPIIYATYIGKNKEYRTEFKNFVAGKKESITAGEYKILKHAKAFKFEGKGVDQKLEKAKQKTREQKEKDMEALKKEKKEIAKKTAKAAKAGKDSKFNLTKLKNAQKRIKKLIGK